MIVLLRRVSWVRCFKSNEFDIAGRSQNDTLFYSSDNQNRSVISTCSVNCRIATLELHEEVGAVKPAAIRTVHEL